MTDLELLQAIRSIVKDEVTASVKAEVATVVRDEVRTIVRDEVRPIVKEEVAAVVRDEVRAIVKEEVAPIHIQIENEILPVIQKLAEGQQNILEHIDQKIEERTENLQGQIDVLNAVVKQHSQDIRELKMAQ